MSRSKTVSQAPKGAYHFHCGTSGWAYPTWKPGFYPVGTSARKFLSYYATQLTSVEVNYTFKSALSEKQTAEWLAAASDDFVFSFKAHQRITNWSRLRDCGQLVAEFFAMLEPFATAKKLGCVLFQLPQNFKPNHDLLAEFLALPELKHHRIAFESLNEEWFSEETFALLRKHRIALCESENERFTAPEIDSAPHRYIRLRQLGGYSASELKAHADKLLASDKELFIYLRHEDEPTGALNARALLATLRGEVSA
ncbi:DUF72 domain-containing protein [Granulicella cerasi]|uniref:DUF72 domain-containing protein n=1 Tax=Granulicella cerasi TaxID=741063 RepID=A0ABW1ZH86_9BACT|nr:DUF72 domain-containing protein [Granulicella cerasi]